MEEDKRPDCRYGSLCYQKNPEHHAKFKHTFKRKERNSDVSHCVESQSKKFKTETSKRPSSSSKSPKIQMKGNSKSPISIKNKDSKSPVLKEHRKEDKSPKRVADKFEKNEPDSNDSSNEEEEKHDDKSETTSQEKHMTDSDEVFEESNSDRKTQRNEEGVNSVKAVSISPEKESREDKECSKHNVSSRESPKSKLDCASDGNNSSNNFLLDDMSHLKDKVKEKYLVKMPEEFFTFWKLCRKLSPKNPLDAFSSINLKLVGPFDILNGNYVDDGLMVTHWRYFYDPPELQTIVISTSTQGLHFGYFRDVPEEDPVFIASNDNKDSTITPVASNLFTFINEQFNQRKSAGKLKSNASPSKNNHSSLHRKLVDFAQALKIDLESPKLSTVIRGRKSKTVCSGLSGVGIVVPYTKKTELGYRPLAKSDKELSTLFRQYKDPTVDASGRKTLKSNLQEVCTWVTIAMDESDFGTGLEFGLDLFGSGIEELHPMVLDTLELAYQFLHRHEFSDILKIHLENRVSPYANLLDEK